MKNKFVCIHGHFYQPPRENPWTEEVETEESAAPDHDWNQRIFRECYQANIDSPIYQEGGRSAKILNNYEHISFNFGPTLLSWLERRHPGAYGRILTADLTSRGVRAGHGNAIAQAYNHVILPLANRRDKLTQIRWGIADFRDRFVRDPEGLWLPETAVDDETLECLIDEGLRFVLLAPRQAVRAEALEKKRPFLWNSKQTPAKKIAVFFYDDALSRGVAFEGLLHDGEAFASRLLEAFAPNDEPEIVVIATDGESYGHHHRFGNMALSYAIDRLSSQGQGIKLVNFGQFLDQYPATDRMEVRPQTSWSCIHGVERWREDCGCSTGAHPEWRQRWRRPLRDALDALAASLDRAFEERAVHFFADPWKARDAYIERVLAKEFAADRFLADHAKIKPGASEAPTALSWCEMQRQRLLMFTSCGWFFDDISGIEAVQILKYAGRALDLAERLGLPAAIEAAFLAALERAPSNDPKLANGAQVYRRLIAPLRVTIRRAAAHFALAEHLDGAIAPYPVFEAKLSPTWRSSQPRSVAQGRLSVRHVAVRDRLTLEAFSATAAVWEQGGSSIECRLRPGPASDESAITERAEAAYKQGDADGLKRFLDRDFDRDKFNLDALFADDGRRARERFTGREKATTW